MRAAAHVLVALLVLIAVPSAPVDAQSGPDTDAAYEELVDVLEVQVPVHVVGKDGEPVKDLSPESFEVLDNGKRQEIRGVETVDLTLVEPGMSRSEIERAVPAAARRRFLLLFDLSFSQASSVLKAREAARAFVLEALHPTDLVAVAKLTAESGAQLVVTFTPDRAQLARAIDTLGAPELLSIGRRRDPLRFLIDEPSGEAGFATQPGSVTSKDHFRSSNAAVQSYLDVISKQMDRMEKGFDQGRIQSWSRSMQNLARAMASVRGRKHLIYFSEGFDGSLLLGERSPEVVAGQSLSSIQQSTAGMLDTDDVYGNTQLQSTVQQMLEEFNRADVVIETVDISGLTGAGGQGAGSRSRRDALFYVANETGGRLYEGSNELAVQMDELLESSSVTWVLTFQPTDLAADGSYHKLKVKADLPKGARLSYRSGYYAPRPFAELHAFEKSLLAADAVAGVTPRSDLDLNLVVAAFRAGEGKTYVPLILEVSGETLLAGQTEDRLPIELYAYVSDDRGEMRDFFTRAVTIDLAGREDNFRGSGLKYYGHFDLDRTGEFLVRVVVRNATTGRTGVETMPVVVTQADHSGPVVLPPFFMEETPSWFMVREEIPDSVGGSVIYPFTVNGQPYVPAAMPVFGRGERARLCVVAYGLAAEDLELQGFVRAAGDEERESLMVELIERTITGIDGVDKLLASFDTGELEPGEHWLEIVLAGRDPDSIATRQVPFRVVE